MATIEHSTLSGSELHDPKSHTHDTLYLKRAAADISTFTEKASPVSADLVIVEDSAASYAKKKVQVGNLPGGGGVTDHGALTGLTDDDHAQYLLVGGTRAMSGNLNMSSNTITSVTGVYGVSQVFAADSASDLNLVAHNTIARCPRLSMYGTTYTNPGDRGSFQFYCPGAGGASQILAMSVGGLTDTPPVYIYYGLSMMTKKITSLGDPTSAQDAATKNYVDTLAGIGTLGGLSDVTITSPASGDTIVHDGVDFKNVNIDTRIMATKLDDFTTPNDNTDLDSSTVQHGLLPKLGGGTVNFLRADGSWAAPPGAAGGETNTASNQGVAGVGVYYQKVGVDLQFKNINAGSNQISITDDTGNHEIDIDVVEANIKLDDLGTPDDNTDLNATTGAHGLLLKLGGGSTNFLRADGTWSEPPGASGGEANTGTNVGTAGVGVFKQKTGVNLEFKKINAGSGNITITDDVANSEVDINVGTNVFLVDGTRAMTGTLYMGGYNISEAEKIQADGYESFVEIRGGAGLGAGSLISVFGKNHSVFPGDIYLNVPNAAGNNWATALSIDGVSNTPIVDILHGLDMNSKKIVSVLDPTAAQDAATKNYVDSSGTGLFEEVANVIREKSTGGYDNDFIIGSPQLADDGNAAHDRRMWFDKSKAAFRVGVATGTQWDDVNVGECSCAEGSDTTASGTASHSEGGGCMASGIFAHAEGQCSLASGVAAHVQGFGGVASGNYSHVEGDMCTATLAAAHAEGYWSTASGSRSHAEGGHTVASGGYSHAEGRYSEAYLIAQHAKACGRFSSTGDAQCSKIVVMRETTDGTQTELTIDGGTPGAGSRTILPAGRSWQFTIDIIARQTGGVSGTIGHSGGYEIKGVIERTSTTTRLVGAITNTTIAEDQGAWAVTAVADNTNECLVVKVTGEANKTIHWVSTVHLTEVG